VGRPWAECALTYVTSVTKARGATRISTVALSVMTAPSTFPRRRIVAPSRTDPLLEALRPICWKLRRQIAAMFLAVARSGNGMVRPCSLPSQR